MPLEPVAILPDPASPIPVGSETFEVRLPIFEGPLQLLLHLIESRQLDILSVPLAQVADAFVDHLSRTPVDASNLSEFVAIAAQLIWLKSRRLLPGDGPPGIAEGADEPDEEDAAQLGQSVPLPL